MISLWFTRAGRAGSEWSSPPLFISQTSLPGIYILHSLRQISLSVIISRGFDHLSMCDSSGSFLFTNIMLIFSSPVRGTSGVENHIVTLKSSFYLIWLIIFIWCKIIYLVWFCDIKWYLWLFARAHFSILWSLFLNSSHISPSHL